MSESTGAKKGPRMTQQEIEEIVRLYASGLPARAVATIVGRSQTAVSRQVAKMSTPRPRVRSGEGSHLWRGGTAAERRMKRLARKRVDKAIFYGRLTPQPCEVCGLVGFNRRGRNLVQAHHDDYSKPFDVRWLCATHHNAWHRHNTAKAVVGGES